jgi:hypothetical protein
MSNDINSMYQYAKKIDTELKNVLNVLPKKAE